MERAARFYETVARLVILVALVLWFRGQYTYSGLTSADKAPTLIDQNVCSLY